MPPKEALEILLAMAIDHMADQDKQPDEYRKQAQAMDIVIRLEQEVEFNG